MAEDFKDIVLKKDIPAFLRSVRPDLVEDFRRDLHNRGSVLYGVLFDSKVLKRQSNPELPSVCFRDYFLKAEDLQIDVSFYEEEGKKKLDWGFVIYSSSNFHRRDWVQVTLSYEKGKWWITQILGD